MQSEPVWYFARAHTRVMRVTMLALVVSLAACGGTTEPSDSGGGSGGVTNAGAPASGGQGTPDAGGTTAGSAGALPAGGSDAGGTTLADQPLLPLVAEHLSRFAFTPIDPSKPMTETCASPTTSVASGPGVSLDGHTGKFYRTFCVDEPFLVEGQGDDLTAYETKNGQLQLPAFNYIHSPVETGEMWDSGRGDKYTWQEVTEPVVTPAGSFRNCWHRQGVDTRITYCRGVGLVRALGNYGNYQLDLIEKNF